MDGIKDCAIGQANKSTGLNKLMIGTQTKKPTSFL